MNFMKKLYHIRIYIITTVFITVIAFLVIYFSITRKKDVYRFLTMIDSYYLEYEYPTFNVNLYSNHIDDYYINLNTIKDIYVKSSSNDDSYLLELKDIISTDESIINDDITYYKYKLNLCFPTLFSKEYQINDVYLEINYLSDEVLKFNIGSIIFYKSIVNDMLSIPCMKPIVNIINDKQIMVGLGLSFNCINNCIIKKIESLDNRISINTKKIGFTNNNQYNNNINIIDFIGTNILSDININVTPDNDLHYIFSLLYDSYETINIIAFRIYYEIEGMTYTHFIYPFKFFSCPLPIKEIVYATNRT